MTAPRWLASVLALAVGVLPLSATPLYSGYNVLVFGNYTSSNTDTGGGLAAGGTVDLTNFRVVNNLLADTLGVYSLVGGVDVKVSGGTVVQGSVYDPIAGGLSAFNVTSGSVVNSGPSPVNFAQAQADLTARSASLAATAANGTANLAFSTLTLTGTNASLNLFSLAASQLSGGVTININVPTNATAIINVSGAAASTTTAQMTFNGFAINGDSTNAQVRNLLWNYYQATSITLSGGVLGTFLAPNADVTGSYTQFGGQLIAKSYTGNTEFHSYSFNGNLPPSGVPEPSTFALALAAGVVVVLRTKLVD